MSTTDPYVPPIMRKKPETMTKQLQATIRYHFVVLGLCQLSYSHIPPIGWKHMSVPRRAPIRETKPPKTGMALAITYALMVTPPVHESQKSQ